MDSLTPRSTIVSRNHMDRPTHKRYKSTHSKRPRRSTKPAMSSLRSRNFTMSVEYSPSPRCSTDPVVQVQVDGPTHKQYKSTHTTRPQKSAKPGMSAQCTLKPVMSSIDYRDSSDVRGSAITSRPMAVSKGPGKTFRQDSSLPRPSLAREAKKMLQKRATGWSWLSAKPQLQNCATVSYAKPELHNWATGCSYAKPLLQHGDTGCSYAKPQLYSRQTGCSLAINHGKFGSVAEINSMLHCNGKWTDEPGKGHQWDILRHCINGLNTNECLNPLEIRVTRPMVSHAHHSYYCPTEDQIRVPQTMRAHTMRAGPVCTVPQTMRARTMGSRPVDIRQERKTVRPAKVPTRRCRTMNIPKTHDKLHLVKTPRMQSKFSL